MSPYVMPKYDLDFLFENLNVARAIEISPGALQFCEVWQKIYEL